jgi:hypothetical protein
MEELRRWLPHGEGATVAAGTNYSPPARDGRGAIEYGQLGVGPNRNQLTWQRVVVPGVVRKLVAGSLHVLRPARDRRGVRLRGQSGRSVRTG